MLSQSKSVRLAVALALFVALLAPPLAAQHGARTIRMDLPRMVKESHVILTGKVLSARAEAHPQLTNLRTIVVTLAVDEVLKGTAGTEFTFRQYIFDVRDELNRLSYKPGDEVLLLMRGESNYGLTSPVGFEQGRFRLSADAAGNRVAVNGMNNAGLLTNAAAGSPGLASRVSGSAQQVLTQHRSGPIAYSDLKSIIRGVVAAQQ